MTKKSGPAADNATLIVWGATLVAALLIIGLCVFIAVKRGQPEQAEPPTVPVVAPLPVELPPVAQQEPEDTAPVLEQYEPPPPVTRSGRPELLLNNLAGTLKISIPFMKIRNKMPLDYSCFRQNISPELSWSAAPPQTVTYAVFMERRDKKGGDAMVNWMAFNIPAATSGLPSDIPKEPDPPGEIRQGRTDYGSPGYIGPCEAKGTYTYALRVFALDTILPVAGGVGQDDLIRAMNGHIIDAAEQEFIHYKRM